MLIELLDIMGFSGKYDFVYLPVNFNSGAGLGYAFINMVSPADVEQIWSRMEGFSNWESTGGDTCEVSWSDPHQGIDVHIERYRNSPVMHPMVPETWKPAVFVKGVRMAFPPPTKAIKAPKIKRTRAALQ
jgi:hypothetical protein